LEPLIVDATASGKGSRKATMDVIGAGARAIAGVMERRGMRPRVAVAEDFLSDSVETSDFGLLLVSGMTSDLTAVRRIVARWRSASSGPIVIGGPIASSPEDAILKARSDLAVIGEGEQTLEELLDLGLDRGQVPEPRELARVRGLAYRDDGLRVNPLRPVMPRKIYDLLTSSTRVIEDYPIFFAARVYVEVLRGCSNYLRAGSASPKGACVDCGRCRTGSLAERYDCPIGLPPGCGYCSVPSLYGPPKSRSVNNVLEETRRLLAIGVRRIVLSAPDFLDYGRDLLVEPEPLTDPRTPEPNYDVLEELLSGLTETKEVSMGSASLMIENIKGSLVSEAAARLLGKHLSGTPVSIGFETGSLEHGSELGRPSTPAETLRAVERLRRAGLKPYVYFIHGLPGQSADTVRETVKAIGDSVQAGSSRIILYRFQPLPMSAFSGHPAAPPAVRDELSGKIHRAAAAANRSLKEELVGRRLRVVVAEPYEKDRKLHVAYPMSHGPVVLVDGARGSAGEVVEVVIKSVVSDRIVRGSLCDATL
jgi:radical SAM superfamily enzyme YgiQ (UPF0313 family)